MGAVTNWWRQVPSITSSERRMKFTKLIENMSRYPDPDRYPTGFSANVVNGGVTTARQAPPSIAYRQQTRNDLRSTLKDE